MKFVATVFALILFHFCHDALGAQTTVAEVNGSSVYSTFGAFDVSGAVDTSTGDIAIDVAEFGGMEVGLAQVDFSNTDTTLEVELQIGANNAAGSFVVNMTDFDGVGSDSLDIAEVYQYRVDLNGLSTSMFQTLTISLDNSFFNLDEFESSTDADDGVINYGLIELGLQSEFGSTDRLDVVVRRVSVVTSEPSTGGGPAQRYIVSRNGRLQVVGNRVMNQFGDPACLAGCSLFWSNFSEGAKFYVSETVDKLASDWNAGIVRASMGVEDFGGYTWNDGEFATREVNKVKTIIDAAIANDVYVIVDYHSHAAEESTAEAVAFFDEISSLYGDNDHVIYEVYNEPINQSWSTIKTYAETVIAAIRVNDPDNLIVVGTPFYSQNVDVASSDPISDPNVAYTLHFYAGTHGQSLRNRAITAMNNGVAIFVTEWGTVNADGNGGVATGSVNTWMDFCRTHELCHANWSVSDKDEGSAVVLPNLGVNGLIGDELTASGIFVKDIVSDWSNFVGKTVETEMVARQIFYNGSDFDGNNPAPDPSDADAIATDKTPLLFGQTAKFANYSSYVHGINGLLIDLEGSWSGLDESDFSFRVGNDDFPETWQDAPAPLSISFAAKAGAGGSDRITLVWDDGVIANQWLEVKILANEKTGLSADDVFYFGNAIGECGTSTTDARVDANDVSAVRGNLSGFFTVDVVNEFDINRDRRVNATDVGIVRNNLSGFFSVRLITPTAGSGKRTLKRSPNIGGKLSPGRRFIEVGR
ncbi:cellulase family glycosylhydrolase [Mariniblastus fucicola]|uniref:Endoglucanase Z n=1 Tax=Mariniblastus fucicola TaxID=980251 RepID=A0A5B9P7X2_9BACT|nr:cellulase family glycosylhydrolase [Mariniblastus fucicola]QEG21062.1 Endoglucanase Z precursor [Mariniblastus fucicola]